MSDFFAAICDVTLESEGKMSTDRSDRGNWTSGQVGVGEFKGTNHGISAAAYPHLDIKALTQDEARAIYRRDYFDKARCGELHPALAMLVFDSAVNNGVGNAVRFLQRAADVADDGVFGPLTLRAVKSKNDIWSLCAEFQRERTNMMRKLSGWASNPGWAVRLATLPCHAAGLVARLAV